MPPLNWDTFVRLPGSPEKNFEALCRGAVRYNFGSYGVLRALANQPGVEFHLKVDHRCDALGVEGRWWGWQCKWYDLAANGALGANRQRKIKEGIRKTEAHVPGVTDWALWTRRPLTKADQDWFNRISTKMTLHLWTADDLDNLLVNQAAVLRGTYFGELVLTTEILRQWHEQAVARIRRRWQPEVHHVVDAERELRRMLGESGSWADLLSLADELGSIVQLVEGAPQVPAAIVPLVEKVVHASRESADTLNQVAVGIRDGDLDLLRDDLTSRPRVLASDITTAPRRLRSGNHRVGLYVTNAIAGCRETLRLLTEVEAAFSSRVAAVLAPAGCGKTQLAAQLTDGTDARPHGVLLHGQDLHANHTLDDLARRVSIAALPVPSMESLLAAVDAAGQRARHRLPIVIDGLNESEDPRHWKPLLAELETMLAKYPYVLLVCSLRTEFVDETLPDETRCVKIDGYGNETIDAIREHFHYYKINATDVSIPIGLLRHPLTLRLFCEVTNPERLKEVDLDAMPGSLTALFDRYLDQVGSRIADLAHQGQRYYPQDVRSALTTVANTLWDSRSRSIDCAELRRVLKDEGRPWDMSLVRALEHEGVLLRMPSDMNDAYVPVYDRLGGHIIANALLARFGQADFEIWIREPSTTTALAGEYNDQHPLANDVIYSLVGQVPRRFHTMQLWQLVDELLRTHALRTAASLDAAYLDTATIDALLDLVRQGDAELLMRLMEVRGTEAHPLNADALDRVLRSLSVADRDLRWTEWLRKNQDEVLPDIEKLEQRWRRREIYRGDQLRARWTMWTLVTTIRRLRDQATRALYWFGRVDPGGLFELTLDSLSVNDVYVSERMLAASYGVVMSHQQADADFEALLRPFLDRLANQLVNSSATAPTNHYLAQIYVRGIISFTERFYASALPDVLCSAWSFGTPAPVSPIDEDDPRADEVGRTLHMDFENYTLGRLFEGRANYDMDHQGHQGAVSHVRGVVWSLGWRAELFEKMDRSIADDFRSGGRGLRPFAERYGKKYGWIGFFTYAGLLEKQRLLPCGNRPFSDVDIDPSFPEPPPVDREVDVSTAWLLPSVESQERWFRENSTSLPRTLLVRNKIGEHDGPWVAVHGFVKTEDRVLGRESWAFLSALVTAKKSTPQLIEALQRGVRPSASQRVPTDHYTFAAEIPWHPRFASEVLENSGPVDAYKEDVRIGTDNHNVVVEILAHHYAWESYHSEMNQANSARVPSRRFSTRFDLRGVPQGFDQCLPDGTRATITLSGVDGLDGDMLYIREDLLMKYVGRRAIIWFAFGERELLPYPSSLPQWLEEAHRQEANAWREVLTEKDIKLCATPHGKKQAGKGQPAVTSEVKNRITKKAFKQPSPK